MKKKAVLTIPLSKEILNLNGIAYTRKQSTFVFQLSYDMDCTWFLSSALQNIRSHRHHPTSAQRFARLCVHVLLKAFMPSPGNLYNYSSRGCAGKSANCTPYASKVLGQMWARPWTARILGSWVRIRLYKKITWKCVTVYENVKNPEDKFAWLQLKNLWLIGRSSSFWY